MKNLAILNLGAGVQSTTAAEGNLRLLEATCQHSVLVVTPTETFWFTKQEDKP